MQPSKKGEGGGVRPHVTPGWDEAIWPDPAHAMTDCMCKCGVTAYAVSSALRCSRIPLSTFSVDQTDRGICCCPCRLSVAMAHYCHHVLLSLPFLRRLHPFCCEIHRINRLMSRALASSCLLPPMARLTG